MQVSTVSRRLNPRRGVLAVLLTAVLLGAGCTRSQPAVYVVSAKIEALPAKQRAQAVDALKRYFGTPESPRLMAPSVAGGGKLLIEKGDPTHLKLGGRIYRRRCAACHGVTGDGNGPAAEYLNPPPRNYLLGKFKFMSTPRGSKPRRLDLIRTIRYGAKGTSMPSFRWLPEKELGAVVDYVILLSRRGELEMQLAMEAELEMEEEDDWGHVAFAADITMGTLHGGRRPLDIYRRIYAGINGTPMPGFSEALKNEPETIWYLVDYVQAVAAGQAFDPADVERFRPEAEPAASVSQ